MLMMKKKKFGLGLLALVTVAMVLFSQFAFAAGEASPTGDSAPVQSSEQVNDPPETTEDPPANPPEETPGGETGDPPSTENPSVGTGEGEEPEDQGGQQPEDETRDENVLPAGANDNYKVTFVDSNGNELTHEIVREGGMVSPATFNEAENKLNLGEHDAFQRWKTSDGREFTPSTAVKKNLTVEPVIAFARTVSFYDSKTAAAPLKTFIVVNGNKLSQADKGYTEPKPTTIPPNNPTLKWVQRNTNTQITGNTIITRDYDVVPRWTYNITYKLNGGKLGTSTADIVREVEVGTTISLPTPVKEESKAESQFQFAEAYEFLGWSTGASGSSPIKGDYPPQSHTNLEAQWGTLPTTKYTVKFLLNGPDSTGNDVIQVTGVAENARIISFPDISPEPGQTYKNTWEDQDGNTLGINAKVTKDLVLTPVFSSNSYTVDFLVEGKNVERVTVAHGAIIPQDKFPNAPDPIDVDVMVDDGSGNMVQQTATCEFLHWADSSGAKWNDDRTVTQNETLRAVFNVPSSGGSGGGGGTVQEYCVATIYPDNNNLSDSYTRRVVKGGTLPRPADPEERADYAFLGWSTSHRAFQEYDFSTTVTANFNLFGYWEKHVNVAFNSDGGSHIGVVTVPLNGKVTRPEDPVKKGYEFKGWSTKRQEGKPVDQLEAFSFDTVIDSALAGPNRLVTLWAWYDSNTKVVFHYNNVEEGRPQETIETVTFEEGDYYVVPYRIPTDTPQLTVIPKGKAFVKWVDSAGKTVESGEPLTVGETLHLYAVWDSGFKINYITSPTNFSPDDETDYVRTQVSYPANTVSVTPPPTYNDSTKQWVPEWFIDKVFTAPAVDFSQINNYLNDSKELNVYGKWVPVPDDTTYTVKYNGNGGKLNKPGEAASESVVYEVKLGTVAPQPKCEGVNGTSFGGWYFDQKCLQPADEQLKQPVVQDMEVYARWVYQVDFVARHKTAPATIYDTKYAVLNSTVPRPKDPALDNLTFGGWTKEPSKGGDQLWDFWKDTVTGNMTLYGAWKATVTFDAGAGTPAPENVDIWVDKTDGDYLKTVVRPPDPQIDGDEFLGWYTDADELFKFRGEEGEVEIQKNTALHAKYKDWQTGQYKLKVHVQKGGNLLTPLKQYYNAGEEIVIKLETLSGYRFLGWLPPNADLIEDTNSLEIRFIMPAYNVNMVAQFQKTKKEVVSTSGGGGGGSSGGGSSSTGSRMLKDPAALRAPAAQQNTATQQTAPAAVFNINGSGRINADRMDDLIASNATKDVVLQGEDITFRFAKGTMRQVPGKEAYSFNASFEVQDQAAIEALAGDALVLTVHYDYDGQLPAEAEITINVGKQYAGRTLYYYYYNPETGALELTQSATVSSDGTVTIRQSHCSDYAFLTVNLYDGADETGSASGAAGAAGGNTGSGGSKQQSATSQTAAPANATGSGTSNRRLPNAGESIPWALTLVGGAALASSLVFLRKFKKALYTGDGKEE